MTETSNRRAAFLHDFQHSNLTVEELRAKHNVTEREYRIWINEEGLTRINCRRHPSKVPNCVRKEILEYAKHHTDEKAAKKYGYSVRSIGSWRRAMNAPKRKRRKKNKQVTVPRVLDNPMLDVMLHNVKKMEEVGVD